MSFTKMGQPIRGHRYKIQQADLVATVRVVGKLYGPGGNADLVGLIVEDENGARGPLPWPLVASEGAPGILIEAI